MIRNKFNTDTEMNKCSIQTRSNLESTINSTFHFEVSKNPEFNPNQSEITSENGIDTSRTTSHTDSVLNPSEVSTCSTYNKSLDDRSENLKLRVGNMPKELMSMFDDIGVATPDYGDFGWDDERIQKSPKPPKRSSRKSISSSTVDERVFQAKLVEAFSDLKK